MPDVNPSNELRPIIPNNSKSDTQPFSTDWRATILRDFNDSIFDEKVKHEYIDLTEKVLAVNSDLTPDSAWGMIKNIEEQEGYKFYGISYSTDPLKMLVTERKRLTALEKLHLISDKDIEQLKKLRASFQKRIDQVIKKTGDDPKEVARNMDLILWHGVAHSLHEAKSILIDGPVIEGFEETMDPQIPNNMVLFFLKDTFGAKTLRKAKIGRVVKDDQYIIFSNYTAEDINRGNELVRRGLVRWKNGMTLAINREAYLQAALYLENVDDPNKLQHLYKIRATSGDTRGFHIIDLHSFGIERSSDFDYLGKISLINEADKMRAYMLGTLAHEVIHRYAPELSKEALEKYKVIVETETKTDRKKYVSDYTLRHEEVYKSNIEIILDEDLAEAVRIYVTNPDYLQKYYPNRFSFIREQLSFIKAGGVVDAVKSLHISRQ